METFSTTKENWGFYSLTVEIRYQLFFKHMNIMYDIIYDKIICLENLFISIESALLFTTVSHALHQFLPA